MTKRRRSKSSIGFILLVVCCLAVMTAGFFLCRYFLLKEPEKEKETLNENKEEKKEEAESFEMDLVDYECFSCDELDFDFVIARIRIKDNKNIRLSLDDFVTDEKNVLSDYKKYTEKLSEKNYYLSMKNIDYAVESSSHSDIFSLFIPLSKNRKEVVLYCGGLTVSIDTTQCRGDLNELYYDSGTFVSSDNYEIFVSNAFVADIVYEDGNLVSVPSSQKIYTFELTVNSCKSGVTLVAATYLENDNSEYEALPSSFSSNEMEVNMMGSSIEKGHSYGLFFKVLSQDSSPTTYDGKLLLKFSDSEEIIEIPAKFE